MGGLGANIGGDRWEAAKKKKEIAAQYANNLKVMNAISNKAKQPKIPEKEVTARDRATEFAKNNVPKPVQKRKDSTTGSNVNRTQLDDPRGSEINDI